MEDVDYTVRRKYNKIIGGARMVLVQLMLLGISHKWSVVEYVSLYVWLCLITRYTVGEGVSVMIYTAMPNGARKWYIYLPFI